MREGQSRALEETEAKVGEVCSEIRNTMAVIEVYLDPQQNAMKNSLDGYSDFENYIVQNLKASQTDEKETPKAQHILTPITLLRSGINKHP